MYFYYYFFLNIYIIIKYFVHLIQSNWKQEVKLIFVHGNDWKLITNWINSDHLGKSHESANKSIYSADSSPASSPSTSPINYSSTQVQVQVHVQTQTVIQKSLYTNTNTNEAPMNLTTNFSSCSLRQQPHDIWSPPVLSPPPGTFIHIIS